MVILKWRRVSITQVIFRPSVATKMYSCISKKVEIAYVIITCMRRQSSAEYTEQPYMVGSKVTGFTNFLR